MLVAVALRDHRRGASALDGICPTCGALGRVLMNGYRARCEYFL